MYMHTYIHVYIYTYIHMYIGEQARRGGQHHRRARAQVRLQGRPPAVRYLNVYVCMCIYIYIERERYLYIHTHISIYIYRYIEREIVR